MKPYILYLIGLSILSLTSCSKDDGEDTPTNKTVQVKGHSYAAKTSSTKSYKSNYKWDEKELKDFKYCKGYCSSAFIEDEISEERDAVLFIESVTENEYTLSFIDEENATLTESKIVKRVNSNAHEHYYKCQFSSTFNVSTSAYKVQVTGPQFIFVGYGESFSFLLNGSLGYEYSYYDLYGDKIYELYSEDSNSTEFTYKVENGKIILTDKNGKNYICTFDGLSVIPESIVLNYNGNEFDLNIDL